VLLEVKDLISAYDGAQICKSISFYVAEGETVTLIGANGAGKTTCLRTVSGLKRVQSGEIRFLGRRIDRLPPQAIVRLGLVQVPEGRALFPHMSVIENLKLGAYLRKDKEQINADLETVFQSFPRLNERKKQIARTLSGGEQQMLAIAAALMGKPKLLLLDEPSSGLSPRMVDEIGQIVRRIRESGTSIFLVEQNARLALELSDRGYVIEVGRIVLEGSGKELSTNEMVRKSYLGG
jgi:branched-chain amino acid transport system ATP-binding protein